MAYFSSSGQFGAGMQNPKFGSWANQSPTPWAENWWQQADPSKAISAEQNDVRRQMNANFNNAANRMGAMGMLGGRGTSGGGGSSTPYAGALGGIATDASRQMADIANKYQYQAASDEANRRAGAWDAGQNRELAWNTSRGNWAMQNQGQQNALAQDWWDKYYNAALQGGSPEWWQNWQTGGIPQMQQYMGAVNPWL